MQANNVRYVQNLRGSLHYLLVKMEAERKALIAKLFAVRKQALALLQRVRKLAVPVDGIIPERPCSHRYYRNLRKVLAARPAPKFGGYLSAGDPVVSEVAKATALLKAKRVQIAAQPAAVHA